MLVKHLNAEIMLEADDYFLVKNADNGHFNITLTCGSGYPIHLQNVSRRQFYNLVRAVEKVKLDQDQQIAQTIIGYAI
jgi:hypothetical protein